MRKLYLLPLSLGLLFTNVSLGQFNPTTPPTLGVGQEVMWNETKATTTCGNDTVMYTLSKATTTEAQSVNQPSQYVAVAQRYEVPQPITVYGMCYYAYVDASGSGPAPITLYMYDVGAPGDIPGSTVLAMATDSVPIGAGTPFSDFQRCVTWSAPVTVTSDFYVALDGSTTTEPLGVTRNSYAFADGSGEALSAVYFDDGSGMAYVKWYNQTTDPVFVSPGPSWDYDYLLEPIVSYDLLLTATVDTDTACSGDMVCVETDSVSPVFNHRMYNQASAGTQTTDWGDGNMGSGDSVCNIYVVGGNYTITHSRTLNGWTIGCPLVETDSVLIEAPIATFSMMQSQDTVTFTNTSAGSNSYMWDFGGLGTSMAMDTTFVFPNGAHTVELIAWSASGCSDTTSQVVVLTVGVEEDQLPQLSIYPNPSQGELNIVNSITGQQFDMAIIDMSGRVVYSDQLIGATNVINLAHLSEGQYFVRIANGTGIRVDKIQILK